MRAMLEMESMAFRYPDGTPALRGVSAAIAEGETVGLVGPNGSGKTTLAMVLAGWLTPTAGTLRWRGRPVGPRDWAGMRAEIGFGFTNPDDQLIMPTVLDDVCFGPLAAGAPPDRVRAEAEHWLRALGIADTASRFPGHLSAGQKRLATLAGILIMQPRLLVLDEPTAFLDPRARREVIAQLRALPQAKLLITHDLELVLALCARVLVLDGGCLAADGPARTLLADAVLMETHGLECPSSLAR